jgi:ATP-binding cassette, subfamily B, multidrug efflux pump
MKTNDTHLTRRLLTYLKAHKRLFILALSLYPLDALAVILPPFLVQQILDKAVVQHNLPLLQILAAAYLGALILEYTSGFASQYAMSILGQRAMISLRSELFAHVQKLPVAYFTRNPAGKILTRLTNDVESIGEAFATGAVTVIADVFTVLAVVGMMLWLDVKLTLFAFLVVPPLVLLAVVFQRLARHSFRAIRVVLANMNGFLSEHILWMSVVQVFNQQERTQKEFATLNFNYRDANRQAIYFDALLFSLVEAIGTAAVAAMIWYGSKDLATGAIKAGTLVAFIQYIRRFFIPIRDLSQKYTILQSAFASAERAFELLDEKIESDIGTTKVEKFSHELCLKDVWFGYQDNPQENEWVLKGIDLHIKCGERVALVGPTGAGKTTVLKLLNRFYDCNRGQVTMDGTDVRDIALEDLRRQFAVVLQDVQLFSGTLKQNLTLDKVDAHTVEAAAKAVGLDEIVSRLPEGYDTHVQELGRNFSAGEGQLLALVRALVFDPQILLLDEATSNIDSETEWRIQKALDVLLQGRTAVIIAHRLSTIRKMDRIVVINHGRVAQEGTHEQLLQKGGIYRDLLELDMQDAS